MPLKADLHIHTSRFSGCSNIDPEDAIKKAAEVNLGMIAFTEHGIRWSEEDIAILVERSRVDNLVVIPGQEVACYSMRGEFQGEFLVFGYPESLGSNKTAERMIEMVHDFGGVVVAAHPFKANANAPGYYGCGKLIEDLKVDGLEIEHPDYCDEERSLARDVMVKKQIAGLACSDAHDLTDIGRYWTILDEGVHNTETLCRTIKMGKTIVSDPCGMSEPLTREVKAP